MYSTDLFKTSLQSKTCTKLDGDEREEGRSVSSRSSCCVGFVESVPERLLHRLPVGFGEVGFQFEEGGHVLLTVGEKKGIF